MLYVGVPLLALGLIMVLRGWIYTLWPNGKIAERRKRRNLKVGFTTDMKLFGRKVRRLGLMVAIVGGGLVGWKLSMSEPAPEKPAKQAKEGPVMLPKSVTSLKPAPMRDTPQLPPAADAKPVDAPRTPPPSPP